MTKRDPLANARKRLADAFIHYVDSESVIDRNCSQATPIEDIFIYELLAHAVLAEVLVDSLFHRICDWSQIKLGTVNPRAQLVFSGGDVTLLTVMREVKVRDFRCDFLLQVNNLDKISHLAIECDGHDFHNKTKDQVARDKARDREFVEENLRVMRFSGSELWRDGPGCARQALGLLIPTLPFHIIDERIAEEDELSSFRLA